MKKIEFRRYTSTYDFVERNNLQAEAEEVLGTEWEAESDIEQIEAILEHIGAVGVEVNFIEGLDVDADIEVSYNEYRAKYENLKKEYEEFKTKRNPLWVGVELENSSGKVNILIGIDQEDGNSLEYCNQADIDLAKESGECPWGHGGKLVITNGDAGVVFDNDHNLIQ